MKKIFLVFMVIALMLTSVLPVYCELQGPVRKLTRGVCNCLTFPAEIPNRIKKVNDSSGPYEAATYGLLQGICMTLVRFGAGVMEVATFPFPIPQNYEPILKDPEFF